VASVGFRGSKLVKKELRKRILDHSGNDSH
jgi:hypothetical protein